MKIRTEISEGLVEVGKAVFSITSDHIESFRLSRLSEKAAKLALGIFWTPDEQTYACVNEFDHGRKIVLDSVRNHGLHELMDIEITWDFQGVSHPANVYAHRIKDVSDSQGGKRFKYSDMTYNSPNTDAENRLPLSALVTTLETTHVVQNAEILSRSLDDLPPSW